MANFGSSSFRPGERSEREPESRDVLDFLDSRFRGNDGGYRPLSLVKKCR